MSWQDDPIVQAPTQDWQSDPIVTQAPNMKGALNTTGTSMNAKTGMAYTPPSSEGAENTVKTLATSLPAAGLNLAKNIGALESGQPDSGGLDSAVTSMNKTREGWMEGNPAAKVADIAGQVAMPMAGGEALVGKAMSYAPEALNAGIKGFAARGVVRAGIGASQGAEVEAMQPHDNETRGQILQAEGQAAKTGAVVNTGLGVVGKLGQWWEQGKALITKKGIEKSTGEALPKIIGQEGVQKLEEHAANPQAKDLTTTDVTQNRDIASAEKNVFKGSDKNAIEARRQNVNAQLAQDVKNTAPEITAPTQVQAQEQAGAAARDISNQERGAIKKSYNDIAPDDTVQAPLEDLQHNLDQIREKNNGLIHGDEEADFAADRTLSEIDNRYSGENETNTGSVKQMIQDKNALGDYINTQYRVLKNPNSIIDADTASTLTKKIDVARQMREALKEHLTGLQDVPSGVTGKSVSEAFGEAETKFKDYNQKYLENPEQFKVNAQGQEYGRSSSAFGDYDYRLQKGTAGTLAQEGKAVLNVENPETLGAQLKTLRNASNADELVKTNLLSAIREKGTEKAFTPEVEEQLKANGFANVASEVKTAGMLHDIRQSVSTTANKLGGKSTTTIDFEKFYDKFDKNRQYLKDNLPKDQYEALDTLSKELQQNTFAARTNANADNTLATKNTDEVRASAIAIKSTISKIAGVPIGGAASIVDWIKVIRWDKVESIVKDAIANPEVALELINAAKVAPKDPSMFKTFIDKAYERIPAATAAVPSHSDGTLKKEQKAVPPKPIDKEVQDVIKPQSSNFSLISDANASEFPGERGGPVTLNRTPVASKKNEFQVADNTSFSKAAKSTGVPESYLRGLEKHEVQGQADPATARPRDKNGNPVGDAFGWGQWKEASWNDLRKRHSDLPEITDKTRYSPHDPRADRDIARLANGYSAADNATKIKDAIGRDATHADGYGAHLMGLAGFIKAYKAGPNSISADIVPAAAKNNRPIFYSDGGKGTALKFKDVYKNLEKSFPTTNKVPYGQTGESDF